MALIAPSIIAADYGHLHTQANDALDAGANWLHLDVMDGQFVPNLTIGPGIVQAMRPIADAHEAALDVHLMIDDPGRFINTFAQAGADVCTVHVEACTHLHRVIQQINQAGMQAGVALNPGTPLAALDAVLPLVDLVLVMSVNPGFSGQQFIDRSTPRIRTLRRQLNAIGSDAYLQVDGGVKPTNAKSLVQAGADVLVAGSAIFGGSNAVAENVNAFRAAMTLKA
ncbi:MAG: ribulose-phosphate 3-epimerase [Longimonas sp.]|uniref:ribulose-phosphate 3-epimerase n=1 Tax=Longimonas sp. TaxID=2039626 RepID=UPI003976BC28